MEFDWKELAPGLEKGQNFALCTIIERHGSVPREVGARMLVRPDGSISGTIGGGSGEHEIIQDAIAALQKGENPVRDYSLVGEQGLDSPAICGGRFSVLISLWQPENDLFLAREAADGLKAGMTRFLLELLPEESCTGNISRALYESNGRKLSGDPSLPDQLAAEDLDSAGPEETRKIESGGRPALLTRLTPPPRMIIFGGGHLALPLVEMASWCRFSVTVIDDRPEFSTRKRFPAADRVITAPMEDISGLFAPSLNLWHVLITREHKHDYILLKQLLGTSYAYLGMIGSRRRTSKVKQRLIDEGFDREEIARLHSPIGLEIGAQTPAEIAVSIMAEIIAVRYGVNIK